MLFSWSATLLKVVMESGTFCSLSERFCAVTVISSSSPDAAAASAANTCHGHISAATPTQAKPCFNIPMLFLPAKSNAASIEPNLLYSQQTFLHEYAGFRAAVAAPQRLR